MNRRDLIYGLLFASLAEAQSQSPVKVKSLLEQKIDNITDPFVFMQLVEIGPGLQSGAHRHPGPVFGYILEGELLTQVEGSAPITYKAGQVFYEPAGHIHMQAKNPSKTVTTRFLAVVIGKQGQPPVSAG